MMKQTAVDYLVEQLNEIGFHTIVIQKIIDKAKEMEKEQIKDSWVNAWQESMINPLEYKFYEPEAEQYYKETYESKTNI